MELLNTPLLFSVDSSSSIRKLDGEKLLDRARALAQEERRVGMALLHCLAEIDRRKLFLPRYSSLHEYVVRELGYSDGAAHRRIAAMRAIRELPEIETKLSNGALNLTTVSQVQDFLKVEKRVLGKAVSLDEKRKIFDQIEGKSSREIERLLAARTPEVASIRAERPRFVDGSTQQVVIRLSPELTRKLEWLKNRMAHSNPSPSLAEQLEALADLVIRWFGGMESASNDMIVAKVVETQGCGTINEPEGPNATEEPEERWKPEEAEGPESPKQCERPRDPEKPEERGEPEVPEGREKCETSAKLNESDKSEECGELTEPVVSAASSLKQTPLPGVLTSRNRYVPISIRREVWRRAGAQCEFRVGAHNTRCTRRHQLQVDHRMPVAWGGRSELSNLQLLCSAHNRWKSDRLG